MKIDLVPMLQVQRDLYAIPRGQERFERYVAAMTGGTRDIVLPLTAMNPMGKEHVAAILDALLALDAERVAAAAVDAARRRLSRVAGELKVGLVVADDAQGGWTNRYLTETTHRFDNDGMLKRGWAVVLLWTSETPSSAVVREQTLGAIYRTLYLRRHGLPRTLRQMMEQEGQAATFAGLPPPALHPEELAAIGAVIRSHLDSVHFPTAFACLYGDEAARSVGYPALGLPPRAGYALALAEAHRRKAAPEAALAGEPVTGRSAWTAETGSRVISHGS